MSQDIYKPRFSLTRLIKKWSISLFVMFSFVAYAINQWLSTDNKSALSAVPVVQSQPASAPSATATLAAGGLRDGVYAGREEDAFYGLVQVQVTVQGGRVAGVKALEYPQDRRTSQWINSQAIPYLTQEAIQIQNPFNMNIISGATLTSEAFIESFQTALDSAKS